MSTITSSSTLVTLSYPAYNPISVTGTLSDGLYADSAATWTITNYGVINGGPVQSSGILLKLGGTIDNRSGSTITGAPGAVYIEGGSGSVNNAGYIASSSGWAISLGSGGVVTNQQFGQIIGTAGGGVTLGAGGGSVDNSGYIKGSGVLYDGVAVSDQSVTNEATGTIFGGRAGVSLAGNYLNNAGTISGNRGVAGTTATIVNSGQIIGSAALAAAIYLAGGTITNQLAGIITGDRGIELTQYGTVDNFGGISGTGSGGVYLANGGTLTNETNSTITGATYGVLAKNQTSTVTNDGSIDGATGDGVQLAAGGAVTNQTNGTITGAVSGVYIGGINGSVDNSGLIVGTSADGVYLASGDLTNQFGGRITGARAVELGQEGTVVNGGSIGGTLDAGVGLFNGGSVTSQTGAYITGASFGIRVQTAVGTVDNAGSITGAAEDGVRLAPRGAITNPAFGTITGGAFGVFVGGTNGSVDNSGFIAGTASDGAYIASGNLANQSGGTIVGTSGVLLQQAGTVVNGGSIVGTMFAGVVLSDGGSVTNQNGAYIVGASYGVQIQVDVGTVDNAGSINGVTADGVRLEAGGSVTNQTSGTITGGAHGVFIEGGNGSVDNSGFIAGTSVDGAYVASGDLTNESGGTITGGSGVVLVQAGTVMNGGSISGTVALGVELRNGGSVTNQSGADITGTSFGVQIENAAGIVDNSGFIAGTAGIGVYLHAGGSVTNTAVGTIQGTEGGVYISGATGTVINDGTITSLGTFGVMLNNGGTVINGATSGTAASIYGMGFGVYVYNAAGTVVNYGTISDGGCSCYGVMGVYLAEGGRVTNAESAVISGYYFGVLAYDAKATVTNAGTIITDSTFLLGAAVALHSGGQVLNEATGLIDSAATGVQAYGATTLTNFGTIIADGLAGAVFANSAKVINGSSTNSTASIYGMGRGLLLAGGGSVTNFGSIAGGVCGCYAYGGIYLRGHGSITNAVSGTISGYKYGVGLRGAATATVTNDGTISGINYGVSAAVSFLGATVVNSGLIEATDAAGIAVYFATTNNLLIVNPGASFVGAIVGHGGDTLELASAVASGTINDLGTGFGTITIDSGATWTLSGPGTVSTGGSLINSGTLTGASIALTGAYLLNQSGGRIDGSNIYGVMGGGADTVINRGTISVATGGAIYLRDAGNVTNDNGALIQGEFGGIKLRGTNATVGNLGRIVSGSTFPQYGVYLRNGGLVTNGAAGTATSTASIEGYYGISFKTVDYLAQNGTLTNYGTIIGTGTGSNAVNLDFGGTVISGISGATAALISGGRFGVDNNGDGDVNNYATIIATQNVGGAYGVFIQGAGTIRNLGTASLIQGYGGIEAALDGTVINAGTIASTQGTSGTAIQFIAGNARVIADPGAIFTGRVFGGSGGTNTMELASAGSRGTLSGIGTQFVSFGTIIEDANAIWTLTGDNTIGAGGTLTVQAGATLTNTGALENEGAIFLDPSVLVTDDLLGTGVVTIDTGSTLDVQGTVSSGETITFTGGASYVHFDSPTNVMGTVTNFDAGDAIDLKGVDQASVNYNSGTLSFTGGSFALSLAAGASLQVTSSGDGALLTALCFCRGTRIRTPAGECRVQDLAVGDLVTTFRGAAQPIVWIGKGKVLAARGRRNAATPVIVRKGALAPNVPSRDLRVTKGHALQLDDMLIPVEFLVNHRSIQWDDRAQEVELYHIELATHDVLVANGAPAESYRDDGNRWLFQNTRDDGLQPMHKPCLPILTGGPRVDEAWHWLLERAGRRPGLPLTDDPDLHLLVDGRRVDHDGNYVFRLSGQPQTVRIESRAAAPQELGLVRDPRLLGVALRRITVSDGVKVRSIEASDALLADGFHDFEPDAGLRWTSGDAILPPDLFRNWSADFAITLHLGGATRYLDEGEGLLAA